MLRKITLGLLFLATAMPLLAADLSEDQREKLMAENTHRRTLIIRDGKVISNEGDLLRRVYLGFSPLDVSSELREYLGAPADGGVVVQSVKEGGPAAKAGLKVGDVVTSVDGKPVESAWNIGDLLDGKKSGDSVRLDIIRNRQHQTLMVTLEERELPMKLRTLDLIPGLPGLEHLRSPDGLPMWKARVEATGNCADLQKHISELEMRLKELERKLQK
jgi:hypothetical protein